MRPEGAAQAARLREKSTHILYTPSLTHTLTHEHTHTHTRLAVWTSKSAKKKFIWQMVKFIRSNEINVTVGKPSSLPLALSLQ